MLSRPGMAPMVVKLGGSLLEDPERRAGILSAVAARRKAGDRIVLVHGGGRRIDAALAARGIPRRVHRGLRLTDVATLETVVSVLCGVVNKTIVTELQALRVPAAGVSGADGPTFEAVPFRDASGVDYGYVGRIVRTDPALVSTLAGTGWMPVVATLAAGAGSLLNVNADAAASALAAALGARRLVFLTDVPGFLDGEGRLVPRLERDRAASLLAGTVEGGMRPKLAACLEAMAAGVGRVVIAGPETQAPVLAGQEGGTVLV